MKVACLVFLSVILRVRTWDDTWHNIIHHELWEHPEGFEPHHTHHCHHHHHHHHDKNKDSSEEKSKDSSNSSDEKLDKNTCEENRDKEEDENVSEEVTESLIKQHYSDDPEEAFQELVEEVMTDDEMSLKYCEKNSHHGATEMYGYYNYKLFIPLKNFDPDLLTVKIKNRVLYIKGEIPEIDPRWQSEDGAHFNDIRRLPFILDELNAVWHLKNGRLELTIPYAFEFNKEVKKSCTADYDTNNIEIIVPQGSEGTTIDPHILDDIFDIKNV